MNILSLIAKIFDPLARMVDDVHTSQEEKLVLRNELVSLQNQLSSEMLKYETELLQSQQKIIVAEAQGQSWLQRNWRPILMLTIVAIIANNYILVPWLQVFGVQAPVLELPNDLYTLMTVGVGGYVGGRTIEKVAPQLAEAWKAGKS